MCYSILSKGEHRATLDRREHEMAELDMSWVTEYQVVKAEEHEETRNFKDFTI